MQARTLFHQSGLQGPANTAIPGPFSSLRAAARYSSDSVMIDLDDSRRYLADGDTLRPIMVAGTQIPGQRPGVTWGTGPFDASVWPLENGASFAAYALGPGIGDVEQRVAFIGDVDQPTLMNPLMSVAYRATVTGLSLIDRPDAWVSVGPLGGTGTPLVPLSYQPPGSTGPVSVAWPITRLNNAGVASIVLRADVNGRSQTHVVVASTESINVLSASGQVLQTDRGPIQLSNGGMLYNASQPLPDGSVFVQGNRVVSGGTRNMVWLARPSGQQQIVATSGDPAPGTEPGVIFRAQSSLEPLAANRNGSLVLFATLDGPGVDSTNNAAIYLWRRGSLTLIARSARNRLIEFGQAGGVWINSRDDIAILSPTEARMFKPGVGTVVVARVGDPVNPTSGLPGQVLRLYSFFGTRFGQISNSGNDDLTLSNLSEDGELMALGSNGAYFGISFSITSPGCPSDFNLDGFTDFFDYLDFVTCFEGGRCPDGKPADFNDDGIADFFDYMEFVDSFETGC